MRHQFINLSLLAILIFWIVAHKYWGRVGRADPKQSVFQIRSDQVLTRRQGVLAVVIVLTAFTLLFTIMAVLEHYFPPGG